MKEIDDIFDEVEEEEQMDIENQSEEEEEEEEDDDEGKWDGCHELLFQSFTYPRIAQYISHLFSKTFYRFARYFHLKIWRSIWMKEI